MKDCINDRLPVKRLSGRLLGFALLLGLFVLGQHESAFAQAGSTGGTIGKQDKSISSGEELQAPVPRRPRSKPPNSTATKQSEDGRGCGRIVGAWKWSNNVDVVVKPDGTADATDGGHAILTCDSGMYVFKWSGVGNMSRLTLAADGKRMSGMGSFGSESAARK
jgi:hypothetical protein